MKHLLLTLSLFLSLGMLADHHKKSDENDFIVINPDTLWGDNYLKETLNMMNYYFKKKVKNLLMVVNKENSFDQRMIGDFSLSDEQLLKNKVIVGERIKRSENIIFKFCYSTHKIITQIFTGQSIKFGNYTCLPKSTVEKMINEEATWNSFSGSLSKIEKDRITSPSIRGIRYFGPSKMSFYNLINHSLSIISVFKFNVLKRSLLFFIVYFCLIFQNISLVTFFPIILLIFLLILIFVISVRENHKELENSLQNIKSIETVK